jgi:hypothetical protein
MPLETSPKRSEWAQKKSSLECLGEIVNIHCKSYNPTSGRCDLDGVNIMNELADGPAMAANGINAEKYEKGRKRPVF